MVRDHAARIAPDEPLLRHRRRQRRDPRARRDRRRARASSGPSWSGFATRSSATAPAARVRPPRSRAPTGAGEAPISSDLRLIRLRMQGLIDQMAAGVARIDALGLTLRDIERGLVDFPALVVGPPGLAVLAARRGARSAGGTTSTRGSTDGGPLAELA